MKLYQVVRVEEKVTLIPSQKIWFDDYTPSSLHTENIRTILGTNLDWDTAVELKNKSAEYYWDKEKIYIIEIPLNHG